MSQHDLDIANQGFPATRADLNLALKALGSSNSGASAPSTTYANQLWYDTANNILKIRNEDNDAWISVIYLDQTNDAVTQIDVDNIRIDGNTISSTDTNGHISLSPNGTGGVVVGDTAPQGDDASVFGPVFTVDSGSYDGLIEIAGNRSDADNTGVAKMQFIQKANSATYKEVAEIAVETDGTTANKRGGSLLFKTRTDNSTDTPTRMTIDSSGNVGIGRSPLAKFDTIIGSGLGGIAVGLSGASDTLIDADLIRLRSGNGTERMRLTSGDVLVGKTATDFGTDGVRLTGAAASNFSVSNGTPMNVNRNGDDGGLINFTQAGILEGGIAVSGTTVSYIGGHISRWSQLTDGTKDTSILKGTVMTNLDQMAVWHHEAQAATYYTEDDELPIVIEATYYTDEDVLPDGVSVGDKKTAAVYASVGDEKTPAVAAYDEDNEQLNCMAVSSVEGDANVAGVFVNWDNDDDDFNDMNIAMTGDMVIRIAQGTTVARGDLLMSAGDGTAKPQGDDIVRSKTIAKITSTNVSHTYDDGTYLVPCVLMAC